MTNSSNPWAPYEDAATILAEETWLQGALLSNIVYGVELTLFAICFALLVKQVNRLDYERPVAFLTFITVIFILGTFFMGANDKFTQLAFVENRNYPGGPSKYENDMFWIPVDELGNVSFVIGNWLMDGLLVWRCMVIHSSLHRPVLYSIMFLPCLMLLASVALGTVFLVQTSRSSPFGAVNFTLAYFCMTLALNVVVTIFIVIRILAFRQRIKKVLGADHVSEYVNVAAILVESASLFSAFMILFIVPTALNSPVAQAFIGAVGQIQTVSSFLIVFRVATGKGWTEDTSTKVMTNASSGGIRLQKISSLRFASEGSTMEVRNASKVAVNVTQELVHDGDMSV
ncbi:uncharacterized protein LAESUDRAFT_698085 [Laetiporus sulphureus 93-53]|uniref:Uncharacterized protein n=1 Tax=Laetiporus sulphureus 93-53 TaxID=1314785 RepID=A0A165EZ42_9APHY|nr:uncharacterized protein LAESUDRAFT_698085 [Laetiporus sulphureus 93-53]KZT08019.1 hypothetical protein LAESUDRAFT_698085 [Laetiporus sulphureus 93-53]